MECSATKNIIYALLRELLLNDEQVNAVLVPYIAAKKALLQAQLQRATAAGQANAADINGQLAKLP